MKTYKGTLNKLYELLANPPAEIAASTHFTINEDNIIYLYPITPQALLEVSATHPNTTITLWRSQGEQK